MMGAAEVKRPLSLKITLSKLKKASFDDALNRVYAGLSPSFDFLSWRWVGSPRFVGLAQLAEGGRGD